MGTHPITAILGGSIVGVLILTCHSRNLLKTLGIAAGLIAIVMAPWIYAVARYGRKVQISGGWIYVFTNSVDRFITRFSPLPWDPRTGHPELDQLGTSYLDAQINFGLLILAVYLLYRNIRQRDTNDLRQFRLALAAFAGFVFVSYASLSQWFWSLMPNALKFVQFSYRLVTYADLFLLFTVVFLLAGTRRILVSPDRPLIAALAVCLMFSTASVGLKLIHALRVEERNTLAGSEWKDTNRDALRSLPSSFYGVNGYGVKSEARGKLPPGKPMLPISIPIGVQEHFGEALPIPIFTNISGVIRTNVQIFPWNHLVWNGREIPPEEIATNQDLVTILPGKSGAGTLEYVLRPDPVWLVLRFLSLWTAAIWAAALPLYYFRTRK